MRQRLLSLEEWVNFIRALGFVGNNVSERDVVLSFVTARMCVADAQADSEQGKLRDSCLPFEGFLESLCRIASMQGLPIETEVQDAGCADAGIYVARLLANKDSRLERMKERGTNWGEQPCQPISACLEHSVAIIIRTVEGVMQEGEVTAGDGLMSLSRHKMTRWCRRQSLHHI